MKAKDVMSKKPEFLPPTALLKEAADFMKKHDCGFVPVGENDKLIGVVTDRDLTIRAVAQGKDPSKTQIRDAMSKGIHFCYETDDIEAVAGHMKQFKIRRMIVLNKDKRMVGIISLGDIATKTKDEELSGEVTEAVSQK